MIVPFRNGRAKVLRAPHYCRIADMIREWDDCDFVIAPETGEQLAALAVGRSKPRRNDAQPVGEWSTS